MHEPQSLLELDPYGHALQVLSNQLLRHTHWQPVSVVPVTLLAWLEQLALMVQVKEHDGNPLKPSTHRSQPVEVFMP